MQNRYYFARQKYYMSKYRTTRDSEERRRIFHKLHQTPEPVVAIAVGDRHMFLL